MIYTQTNADLLALIGNTPIVELKSFDTGPCRLFVKLESQNPTGSIKDRIAVSMIDAAERSGALKPGGRIIEATAGNTGLALALVAIRRGYRLTLVIPDKMSREKIAHLRRAGHRGGAHALGCAQGPSGLLPGLGDPHRQGNGRILHGSVQQSEQSAGARDGPLARRFWSRLGT